MDIQLLEKQYTEQVNIANKALEESNRIKSIYWKDFFEKIKIEIEKFHGLENATFKNVSICKRNVDVMIHGYSNELLITYIINGDYKRLDIGLIFVDDETEEFNRYYNSQLTSSNNRHLMLERNILLLYKEKQNATEVFKLNSITIFE